MGISFIFHFFSERQIGVVAKSLGLELEGRGLSSGSVCILGRLLKYSVPQFTSLCNGHIKSPGLIGLYEDQRRQCS